MDQLRCPSPAPHRPSSGPRVQSDLNMPEGSPRHRIWLAACLPACCWSWLLCSRLTHVLRSRAGDTDRTGTFSVASTVGTSKATHRSSRSVDSGWGGSSFSFLGPMRGAVWKGLVDVARWSGGGVEMSKGSHPLCWHLGRNRLMCGPGEQGAISGVWRYQHCGGRGGGGSVGLPRFD